MLAYVALALVALALWRCPFWGAGKRVFLPLYLWALYCAVAPINLLGVTLLAYRWPLAILSGVVGLYWWSTSRNRPVDKVTYGCLFVIALALVSTSWSRLPEYTLSRALALLPIFAFTILGVRSLLTRRGAVEAVGICVILAHAIPVALAFSSSMEQEVYIETEISSGASRFQGYSKATGTAHSIVSVFPFLFWFVKHSKATNKLINLGAFGYLTYLLLATRTRASLATALLLIPTSWSTIVSQRKAGGTALAAILFLASLGVGLQFVPDEVIQGVARTKSAEDLVRTRKEGRWDMIWEQSMESPILGHGLGTVRFYRSPLANFDFSAADESRRALQTHTHNEYLSLFYDLGFLPPLLFLAFGWAAVRAGMRWIHKPGSRLRDFQVAVFLSTIADLINTVSHDGLMTVGNPGSTFFWIKCMMFMASYPQAKR